MKLHRSMEDWTLPGAVFNRLGRAFLSTVVGEQLLLFFRTVHSLFFEERDFFADAKSIISQIYFTAVEIFPVLFAIATLTGTVTIIEALMVMPRVGFSDSFGGLMVVVLVREIGPILTAFLIAGRSGSALTTMIGTMSINSEVDALSTLGISPIRYLVMPALFGGTIALLVSSILFSVSSVCAGFAVTKIIMAVSGDALNLHISWHYLATAILNALTPTDFFMVVAKPIAFGCIIFTNACYRGLNIHRDIRQVPKAASRSVIYSFLAIIIVDVLFSLFYIFDYINRVTRII